MYSSRVKCYCCFKMMIAYFGCLFRLFLVSMLIKVSP